MPLFLLLIGQEKSGTSYPAPIVFGIFGSPAAFAESRLKIETL